MTSISRVSSSVKPSSHGFSYPFLASFCVTVIMFLTILSMQLCKRTSVWCGSPCLRPHRVGYRSLGNIYVYGQSSSLELVFQCKIRFIVNTVPESMVKPHHMIYHINSFVSVQIVQVIHIDVVYLKCWIQIIFTESFLIHILREAISIFHIVFGQYIRVWTIFHS